MTQTQSIREIQQLLKNKFRQRDRWIVREAIKGKESYEEIGLRCDPPIVRERVKQILHKAGVSVAMKPGMVKFLKWRQKITEGKRGTKYKKNDKNKSQNHVAGKSRSQG